MFSKCSKAVVLIGTAIVVAVGLSIYLWGFGGIEAISNALNGQSGRSELNNGTELTSAPSPAPAITFSPAFATKAPTLSGSNVSVTGTPASTSSPTEQPSVSSSNTTFSPTLDTNVPTLAPTTISPTPGEGTQKPTLKYDSNHTNSPTDCNTMKPSASTDSPTDSGTNAPTPLTSSPKSSTETPTTTTNSPTASTNSTRGSTQSPTAATASPTTSTESPTASTGSPKASTETPTASTESPTSSTESPTASTESPTASTGTGLDYIRVVFTDEASTSVSVRAAFKSAAQRWSDILKNFAIEEDNVPADFGFNANAGCRLITEALIPAGPISQLTIAAEIAPIDGSGGVLARAGFCGVFQLKKGSTTTYFPLIGQMTFDSADLASMEADGRLEDVILHEMGHVIGIGSMWNLPFTIKGNSFPQLLQDAIFQFVGGRITANPYNDPHYVGSNAKAAFATIGGSGDVPVEDGSFSGLSAQQIRTGQGRGSIDSHWRETTFDNELMSPAINGGGVANPLSQLSLRSLEDLQYDVDISQADSYTLPASRTSSAHSGATLQEARISMEGDVMMPSEDAIQRGIERVRRRARSKRRLTGSGTVSVFDLN